MPTPGDCTQSCPPYGARSTNVRLLVALSLLSITAGCQSTRLAKVPGMGWLSADDQPPVLETANGETSYPPPSASSVPTALSETSEGSRSLGPASATGGSTDAYNTAATAPPAAAVPRSMPATTPPGQVQLATATSPATNTTTSPTAATADYESTAATTSTNANGLPIGLPPGVTAPNLASLGPTSEVTPAAEVQQGPYALMNSANGGPATVPPSQPVSAAAAPAASSVAASDSDFPMPDSGSATTWDYPTNTGRDTTQVAANTSDGDFQPTSPAASGNPMGNAQPIPTIETNNSTDATATYNAPASHYESIAAEQTANQSLGPWRPGSTTDFVPSMANSAPSAAFQ